MAKAAKKKVAKTKLKKKLWFKITAPKIFGQKEIGESYLQKAADAVGRSMTVNLKDLSGSLKDQNISILFRLNKVDGSTLRTNAIGYTLSSAHTKRAVRKNTSRIDEVYKLTTKSKQDVIVKMFVVTRNKVQRSVGTAIRAQLGQLLQEQLAKGSFDAFMTLIVARKFQIGAKKTLSKLHPIKDVSVRVLKLVEKGISNSEQEEQEEEMQDEEQANEDDSQEQEDSSEQTDEQDEESKE